MLAKDELNIIRIVRLAPAFVVLLSLCAIIIYLINSNNQFNQEVEQLKQSSIQEKKDLIKAEVLKVHDFIRHQKAQTIEKIKANLKERVREAHAIANAIYINNKQKPAGEVKKLISDALRDIRFNQGRGYFFVYQTDGMSVMHPILPHLQNTDLWNFTDVKGSYVIRDLSKIATTQGEGFLRWWWRKPADIETEYEKIGYSIYFKPFDWFIGTGDYVLDYEAELQQDLLKTVNRIKYGADGYIFVIDNQGTFLSHFNKDNLGQNRIDLVDINGVEVTKKLLQAAHLGEDYVSYVGTIKPTTGLPERKISYVKGFKDWQWAIGSGAYLDDIDKDIALRKSLLNKKHNQKLTQAILIGSALASLLFITSLIFANSIKKRFEQYKRSVNEKNSQLNELNKHLESKVKQRTHELSQSNAELATTLEHLQDAQNKLIESEKMSSMLGLVSGIAHELNSPLGVMVTSMSQIEVKVSHIFSQIKAQKLTKSELKQVEEAYQSGVSLVNRNLEKAIQLVQSFKSLSIDNNIEKIQVFNLDELIALIVNSYQSILKKHQVELTLNLQSNIDIETDKPVLTEVIAQLIDNSLLHAFEDVDTRKITIATTIENNTAIISYQDNGSGLSEQAVGKIFEPFYTTKRSSKCTGLGMPIVYNQITHKLIGSIACKRLTQGLGFTIKLPISRNA